VDKLRTGFITLQRKLCPDYSCWIDYKKREVILGEPFYPSEDVHKDIASLTLFYSKITGKNPELGFINLKFTIILPIERLRIQANSFFVVILSQTKFMKKIIYY